MFDDGPDDADTVFRDVITLALAGFVAAVILLLPHVNPKAKVAEAASSEPPGNVVIEARWPDGLPVDIDTWVEGPDGVAVGYSNKQSLLFNLLRDDLGSKGDLGSLNYEVQYSRGLPPGEYIVNLHWYRDDRTSTDPSGPVLVEVTASVKLQPNESAQPIAKTKVEMLEQGVEVTAIRFRLDADGGVVPGSINHLFRPLRSAGS